MKPIQKYRGHTMTLGFNLEVHQDSKTGDYVATLNTHTPAFVPEKQPGQPYEVMRFNDPEEIRHRDLQELTDNCKQRIVELGGEIIRCDEVPLE